MKKSKNGNKIRPSIKTKHPMIKYAFLYTVIRILTILYSLLANGLYRLNVIAFAIPNSVIDNIPNIFVNNPDKP